MILIGGASETGHDGLGAFQEWPQLASVRDQCCNKGYSEIYVGLFNISNIGRELISIIIYLPSMHYTRPGSSIKWPNPNYLCHVNWGVL